MEDINKTLEERGKQYGDFQGHAEITVCIKDIIRRSPSFCRMEFNEVEALDMIAHKIGRICNGNPHYADSWIDIAGYATLVARELEKQPLL